MITPAEFQHFVLALSIFVPALVCPLVSYRSARLVEALKRARGDLEVLAQTDQLTGLLNRRGFDAAAHAALEAGRAANRPVAVLTCDIDHFKKLNDSFGHGFGDKALLHVAEVLRRFALSRHLVAGRQGGDEFVILAPGIGRAEAAGIAESIRIACGKMPLEDNAAGAILSVSIGVAVCAGSQASLSALMRRADVALYDAKRIGRNRVVAADLGERWSNAA
jgi:diguanylate cyclase (GGDEF)-like protein